MACLCITSIIEKRFEKKLTSKILEGKKGDLFLEKEYAASADGLKIESVVASNFYTWESIMRFDESESVIYMFANSIEEIIILKKCIGSDTKVSEFKKYLNNYIENY